MHSLVAVLAALQLTVATPSAHTSQLSWNDVGSILAAHCVDCHRVGGIAPFALTSAKDAKAHAQACAHTLGWSHALHALEDQADPVGV